MAAHGDSQCTPLRSVEETIKVSHHCFLFIIDCLYIEGAYMEAHSRTKWIAIVQIWVNKNTERFIVKSPCSCSVHKFIGKCNN